jgi:hypothetical protein
MIDAPSGLVGAEDFFSDLAEVLIHLPDNFNAHEGACNAETPLPAIRIDSNW